MIFKLSTLHRIFFTYFCPTFYGGAPSTPSNTTSTVNQNTIPAELMPYAKSTLSAAQSQLYTLDGSGNVTGYQPYKPFSTNPSNYFAGFTPLQQQAQQGAANLQTPTQFGAATDLVGTAGQGLLGSANQAQGYGTQGAQSGQLGQGIGVAGGLNTAGQALGYGGMGAGLGAQSVQAGQGLQNTYTDPNAMAQYMNPYIQNALNPALQLSNQSFGMKGAQEQSDATRSGAFGGSREALMNSLNNQSRDLANQQMIGSAYNQAYTNAQQAAQQANTAQLQGLQQGIQGAGVGLQGVQGAQAGVNQALAGTAQGMQGAGVGLTGVSGTQAGLAGAANAGTDLSSIGGQQQQAQINILNAQNAAGTQQQQYNQGIINQDVLNYQNAVNQPYLAAGTMSDLIRGTPVNNTTTMTYQAQPSIGTQLGGALGSAASLYKAVGAKNGGIIQAYNEGGVTDVSAVSSYLDKLTVPQLETLLAKSTSVENSKTIQDVIDSKSGTHTAKNGGILRFNGEHGGFVGEDYGVNRPYEFDFPESSKPTEEYTKRGINQAAKDKTSIARRSYKEQLAKQGFESRGAGKPMSAEAAEWQSKALAQEKAAARAKALQEAIPETASRGISAAKTARLGALGLMSYSPEAGANSDFKGTEERPPVWEGFKEDTQTPNSIVNTQQPAPTENPKAITAAAPVNTAPPAPTAPPAQPNTPANTGASQNLNNAIPNAMVNQNMTQPVVSNADERGAPKDEANYDGMEEDKRLSKMSAEDIMRERNEEKKRLGILSPEDMGAEQRKQIMEERANAKDEMKRNTYLRMAEFFANWGSTPGAPLVAGLKALKETMPGYMEDTKAHHKLTMDLNKSIRDMDMAVNLEKSGQYDKASSIKESVSERLQKHGETMALMAMRKEIADKELASNERRTNVTAKAGIAEAMLRANGSGNSAAWTPQKRAIANAKVDAATQKDMKDWDTNHKYGMAPKEKEVKRSAYERERYTYHHNNHFNGVPDESGINTPSPVQSLSLEQQNAERAKMGLPPKGAQ